MISYLVYSTVSMGLLLLFYHMVLEKEKMHHINRGYLLFSLVFSLVIPFIPVGIADAGSWLSWLHLGQEPEIQLFTYGSYFGGELPEFSGEGIAPLAEPSASSFHLFTQIALVIYSIVAITLFVRLLRIIHMIQMKADRNPRRRFDSYEIVLLSEKVVPHTFISSIFVSKEQYEKGEIQREVLIHELTHAKQKHTLDILFIEMLKILFWFNPLIYFYKKAALLNHEFLADQAVISTGTPVSEYQKLLLNTLLIQPVHGLSSNLNYSLTKKRLVMMTQATHRFRSLLKMMLLFPLFISLGLLLGCESTPADHSENEEVSTELRIEIFDSETIKVNDEEIHVSELDGYLSVTAEPDSVQVIAHPDASIGVVTDVQAIIRDLGILKINYSTADKELERVTDDYQEAVKVYTEMDVETTPGEDLKEAYQNLVEHYDAIKEAMNSVPNAPPPPPFPPSPEESLKNPAPLNEADEQEPPPPPVEARNLMQILVNAQGYLLLNEEPATVNEVKDLVKQFIDNKNTDPALSENPDEAIIGIKTDRQTPYDIYTKILDEVMAAYDELRDQAAKERFGVSYNSLESNSPRREEIREMYPKRISIAEPPER
ncbi:MAG: M56 family metallopeptidase [Balneolaceae bacterium]